ncbi:MAG: glycosyltransferase [Lachnospiraceae bacterium]|nr:glycosyltransferase [Lachnospiraceae bacterium]
MKKFYSDARCEIKVQPFAPVLNLEYAVTDNIDLKKYNLPEKYFIICNQFWQHKNHITAFRAMLKMIREGNEDVYMVCTGHKDDYRLKSFNRRLREWLDENELMDKIIFTGYIPKLDQIEMMKNSIALVQPTLFEGDPGGCAVYDAVSMGIRVILSDIDVNLELDGTEDCYFFRKKDSDDLYRKMMEISSAPKFKYSEEKAMQKRIVNLKKQADFWGKIVNLD